MEALRRPKASAGDAENLPAQRGPLSRSLTARSLIYLGAKVLLLERKALAEAGTQVFTTEPSVRVLKGTSSSAPTCRRIDDSIFCGEVVIVEPFELTEHLIREHSAPESIRRGEDYYRQGAVLSVTRRGAMLQAEVAGSDFAPYNVRVSFDEAGSTDATCSCPYDWGGWCKHIVAALLACVREPEIVQDLPALEETLSTLDRGQLQGLLLKLAERDPSLADVIEGEISPSMTSSDARQVNVEAIRRRVRSSLQPPGYMDPYGDYRHTGGNVDEARRILDGVWDSIRSGDGRGALPVLEAITEEYMES